MKKILLILFSILAALLLIIQLSAPSVIRSYVNKNGTELLGRDIYLGDISVNIFGGVVRLDSVVVFGQTPDEEPFIQLHEMRANLVMRHLLLGIFDMEYFTLDGLRINVEQRDTVFNFSDVLMHISDTDEEFEGLPVVLRNIAITNSYLHYQDLLVHSNFRINDITLHIPGLDLREINTDVGMDLTFFDGGSLSTQFNYDDRRKNYTLDLKVTDFNMEGLLPYVQQMLLATSLEGKLNGELQMKGSISHILDFQMKGSGSVHNFLMRDQDDEVALYCDSLGIGVNEMNLLKNRISLSHLIVQNPLINITYQSDSLDNFTRMLQLAQEQTQLAEEGAYIDETAQPDNQPDFQLFINQLQMRGGTLNYHDLATRVEPFHYNVSELTLNAPQFTLTGYNNIKGKARMGDNGSFILEYHGKLTDPHNLRVNASVTNISLPDFTPYTLQMFGNEITQGIFSGQLDATVTQGDVLGTIHLTALEPKVSKRHKDIKPEMKVPFRAGIYALTDKNGVCDMKLPVKGNVDEPEFSYKRLIFKTIGKLFIKICVSPFRRHKGTVTDSTLTMSQEYLDFDVDDVYLESFGTDSIGEALMREEEE